MATTTESAVRDRIAVVIAALVPTSHADDRFRESLYEEAADFELECERDPESSHRRFAVIDDGEGLTPTVSNMTVVELFVTFQVWVAYPHSHRAGGGNASDRYKIMRQDQHQIEQNIGLHGRENFTSPTGPDASWRSGSSRRVKGRGCDFLVIEQTMAFFRSMT